MLRKGGMTRVLRHATVKGARLRVLLALAGVEDAQGVTTTTRAVLWARAEVPWWAGWWLLRDLERRGMLAVGRAQARGRYAVLVGLTADEVQAVRARLDARRLG